MSFGQVLPSGTLGQHGYLMEFPEGDAKHKPKDFFQKTEANSKEKHLLPVPSLRPDVLPGTLPNNPPAPSLTYSSCVRNDIGRMPWGLVGAPFWPHGAPVQNHNMWAP